MFSISGIAFGNVTSKSIMTTAGECPPDCGGAVLTPDGAFSGQIFFSDDQKGTTIEIVDYICQHVPGGAAFKSVGGSYTLEVSEGASVLTTATYAAANNTDCTDNTFAGLSGASSGATFTVPADGSVSYKVWRSGGFSFASNVNAVLNRVAGFDTAGVAAGHANSLSVAKPGPPPVIPEAPMSILLILSAGAVALWFVSRRMRPTRTTTA